VPTTTVLMLTRSPGSPYALRGVRSSPHSFPPRRDDRAGNRGVAQRHVQRSDRSVKNHHHSTTRGRVPGRSVAGHDHQRAISFSGLQLGDRDGWHRAGIGDVHAA
jgi:hypothetical protein